VYAAAAAVAAAAAAAAAAQAEGIGTVIFVLYQLRLSPRQCLVVLYWYMFTLIPFCIYLK
jgi:energy-converting hydrogenase Eha subunit C